jgi:hypothetical protein
VTSAYTAARLVLGSTDAFASAPALNALAALLGGIPQVQSVTLGIPDYRQNRLSASIALGSMQPDDEATQLLTRTIRINVIFYYRLDMETGMPVEANAELSLASAIDAFTIAFYEARPSAIFGTLRQVAMDFSPADTPDYQLAAGREARVYPILISGTQRQSLS